MNENPVRQKTLRLLERVSKIFKPFIEEWFDMTYSGKQPYSKPYTYNGIRIYLSAFINHVMCLLEADFSNFYDATIKAINNCKRDQYPLKKDIKASSISIAKYLVSKGLLNECIVQDLRNIKLKNHIEPFRPVVRYKDFQKLIHFIENSELENKKMLLALIYALFFTGMRASEICNLRLEDIDFEEDTIFIRKRKGGKHTRIGLHSKLKPILYSYLKVRNKLVFNNRVFLNKLGNELSVDYLTKIVSNLCKQIGLKASNHAFRRGFCTYAVERNVPITEVQQVLGHSSYKTTLSYYRPDEENVIKKMINW